MTQPLQLVPAPRGKRLRLPLRNSWEVARELAHVYRRVKAGQVTVADGAQMARMLEALGRIMANHVQEQRVNNAIKKVHEREGEADE